ncbi:Rhamnose-binding lectin [Labeo rohita]|uniref:Rhamnose-binding lectin n=1 Tax=Labeo rohita TaxID=84645 RepID=A0ABQ8MEW0_LABRO|nr:Rhamnose-binding lectin [Labeo rohita]
MLLNSRLLISAETVITCDGNVQHLSCDTGVISVRSATCGRTSSLICSVGQPPSETSNTKCSVDVPAVSKRCNGLRQCELNTQGLAPRDPCYGTYKYYTTNYICIPAETSVTCHYGYSYLKCENGRIQINTANYGRTDKTTCSEGRPSEQVQNTNCYSPNALSLVSKSCEVFANHMVFTDPCVGTYKYLAISYFCLPPAVRSSLVCNNEMSVLTCGLSSTDKTIHTLESAMEVMLLNFKLLISAETVVTCDGPFVQRLICDTGVISVQSATFGRTSSLICSAGRPPSEISNTQCSIDVPAVSKRCNGLRQCEIDAQGLAPRDPCVGTYKYYTTNYICIPAEYGKIQINTANYGRTDKTTCSEGRPSSELQNTNCYSPNALSPVSKRCEGKNSCSILASNSVFSDPCGGTFKYLYILYTCEYKCKC